jgi:hypothetical protein
MAINADTVYAYALCLSIHGFCQTKEDAQQKASEIEPMQAVHGSDYWEHGYVIEIAPGELSDDLYQGSDGKNDLVIWNDNTHYVFGRPEWMKMVRSIPKPIPNSRILNPATARPMRK